MEYEGPFYYRLRLHGSEDKRVLTKKDLDGNATTFKDPVTQNKTPKIYILKQEEEVVYIGYASQSIGTRFGQGIRANGANGYHGYKWKQEEELELFVFVFDNLLIGNKNKEDEPYVLLAEAVEAELVYLVRTKTGMWPKYQNEIHFNNNNLLRAKEIALKMFNTIDSELPWYQPDTRWEIWGIKTKEEFIDRYVVPGKFHNRVPKDVVEAFETVTYLMAHSYYHYEMLDVAIEKALLIMELAIKLKAQELEIELKREPNKRNEVYDKTLNELIREVCKHKELTFLKPEFDRARQWRNTKMHPKKHTISGPIGYPNRNAKLFVNVINKLFMTKKELSYIDKKQKALKDKIKKFTSRLFVLEYSKGKILITTIYELKFIKMGQKEVMVIFLQPVLNDVIAAVQNYDHTPLIIGFSEFSIDRHTISGVDINNKKVRIYPSSEPKNIPVWEKYENDWASLTEDQQNEFIHFNAREALWKMEELIYEHCWS